MAAAILRSATTQEQLDDALCRFSMHGQEEAVAALLADGRADPNAYCTSALCSATTQGHMGVVRALLADGRADPATCNSWALRRCARIFWRETALRALIADGRSDPSAVKFAECSRGNWRVVQAAVRWRRRRQWLRAGMKALVMS
jgi:hypothetical protein